MSLRQQQKAHTRARIVAAAVDLIRETGLAAATTRAIAARAGVSYQTLYNYFPSKSHVVQAILADDVATWSAAVDACIKQYEGNLLDTLDSINRLGFALFAGPNEALWRAFGESMLRGSSVASRSAEGVAAEGFMADQPGTLNQVGHDRLYALLSMAQGTGELGGEVDLHLLAHTVFCLSDYALLRYFASTEADSERAIDNLQQQLTLLLAPRLTRPA